jgi:hypothetical protein
VTSHTGLVEGLHPIIAHALLLKLANHLLLLALHLEELLIATEQEVSVAAVLHLHIHDVAILGDDVLHGGPQTRVNLIMRSTVCSSDLRL